ncbi:unnamed protein product [Spirodela intermedia]|uniref:Uncharacterized protein n=2 Tax=Spirodela intermedia TaxID=51605 RepID=A0A7I8KS70_SPIIN|nr:unnamed protein product [Spirodela intermedia]CAA6664122.1 unnamed protein product [Spirodela intermedia]CAA7400650.1 unnamed protein product [Spirodela intermedia]
MTTPASPVIRLSAERMKNGGRPLDELLEKSSHGERKRDRARWQRSGYISEAEGTFAGVVSPVGGSSKRGRHRPSPRAVT